MSINIKLKINSKNTTSYTPDYLPSSVSDILFTDKIDSTELSHKYPRYNSINLFELITFSAIFESFDNANKNSGQENLISYVKRSYYNNGIYNQLKLSLVGKVACMLNSQYDYVYEDEVQKCYTYVMDNLHVLYNQFKEFINTAKNTRSHRAFYEFSKHLIKSNNILYANTQYNTLKTFKLHMYYSYEKYKEVRNNVPPFIPAGTCDCSQREIFINTHHWQDYRKFGTTMRLRSFYHTYLHELGHAVDYPREEIKLFNQVELCPKNREVSQHPDFLRYVKQSYFNKKKVKTKKNGYLSYYMCPQFEVNKKVTKKKNLISVDWYRASQEAFAESFGYLCYWYLNGVGKADILFIDGTHYKKLIIIKTLMPVLQMLAIQLNWEFIGIPKHLISKRRKMIMAYLKYVKDLDYSPRNTNVKGMRSNDVKKPTLQKLLRKKLK